MIFSTGDRGVSAVALCGGRYEPGSAQGGSRGAQRQQYVQGHYLASSRRNQNLRTIRRATAKIFLECPFKLQLASSPGNPPIRRACTSCDRAIVGARQHIEWLTTALSPAGQEQTRRSTKIIGAYIFQQYTRRCSVQEPNSQVHRTRIFFVNCGHIFKPQKHIAKPPTSSGSRSWCGRCR